MSQLIISFSLLLFYPFLVSSFAANTFTISLNILLYTYLLYPLRRVIFLYKYLFFNLVFAFLFVNIYIYSATPFYSIFATFRTYYIPVLLLPYFLLFCRSERNLSSLRKLINFFFLLFLGFQIIELLSIQLFPFLMPLLQPSNDLGLYSRPIGFLQDYQSVPFILGLSIIYFFINKSYRLIPIIMLIFSASNMRTHLFASVGALAFYIICVSLLRFMSTRKLNLGYLVFSLSFTLLIFIFVLPILIHQINSNSSTLSIVLDYVIQDFRFYTSNINLFGTGVFDYSSEALYSIYSEVVLRNEIGFLRMLFELGWIPTFALLFNIFSLIILPLSYDVPLALSLLVYISLGLLHHVTVFSLPCMLFLGFFILHCSSSFSQNLAKNNL